MPDNTLICNNKNVNFIFLMTRKIINILVDIRIRIPYGYVGLVDFQVEKIMK